jgi:hypothetical protein
MDTIYYNTLSYATVDPDSLAFRKIMPSLSYLPTKSADYKMTYRLTQDSIDYDPEDNIVSFSFSTGGNTLALEDGFTTAVTVGNSLYDDAAPPSYAYGNYFRPVTQAGVQSIDWGVGNAEDMAGQIVQIYLLQWTDNNQNHIAESIERKFIGFANYSFTGQEGENVILSSPLENFESPGSPVIMEAGLGYIAIVEYQADSEDDPDFFMLASDKRNYTPQQVAMDSAVVSGLVSEPIYFSVLGFSADGIVTNIDYEVKELSLTDNRIFFGNDIVPVVRIIVSHLDTVIAVQSLPHTYQVSTFPNPVNDFFNVHLDFPIPIENALLSLISENGSRILTQKIETGSSMHTASMDVSSFPTGQYYLNIRTPQGERTLPLAVVH